MTDKKLNNIIHYKEIEYGFEYGSAKITRLFSDTKKKWITLGLETPKYKGNKGIQIYITKTGKVRIHDTTGEWTAPQRKTGTIRELIDSQEKQYVKYDKVLRNERGRIQITNMEE